MNIFLINFILMLIEAMFLLYQPQKNPNLSQEELQKKKKWFVMLQGFQWILISGLRGDLVGADTPNYLRIFDIHGKLSWRECFEYFKMYYLEDKLIYEFEPGYVLFEKLVATIWNHHGFYKFVVAVIFMSSLGRFVYRNSDDPFVAYMLYSGLFYNMFSLTGYRQVISVSIGFLCAYDYIHQRKFFKFLFLVLVAATLHKSSLIFIAFYFLSRKKITTEYAIIVIVTIIGMICYRNQLFDYVKVIVGYDEFGVESGFTQRNFLLLFTVLSILVLWRYTPVAKNWSEAGMYYNGFILTAAMIPFAMVSPTALRLVYDFGFTLMVLVPKVFQSFMDKQDRMIVYVCSTLIFGYFIATKAIPYEFFWQGM